MTAQRSPSSASPGRNVPEPVVRPTGSSSPPAWAIPPRWLGSSSPNPRGQQRPRSLWGPSWSEPVDAAAPGPSLEMGLSLRQVMSSPFSARAHSPPCSRVTVEGTEVKHQHARRGQGSPGPCPLLTSALPESPPASCSLFPSRPALCKAVTHPDCGNSEHCPCVFTVASCCPLSHLGFMDEDAELRGCLCSPRPGSHTRPSGDFNSSCSGPQDYAPNSYAGARPHSHL